MKTETAAEEPASVSQVDQAMGLLGEVVTEINTAMTRMKRGEFDDVKDAVRSYRDLRQALQIVFEERTRIAKLDKQEAGIAYDYALDLGAARAEIGRRLSCLRIAGDG